MKRIINSGSWLVIFLFLMSFIQVEEDNAAIKDLYNQIQSEHKKPEYKVFKYAMEGYYQLEKEGKLGDKQILTVIDFSVSANKKRMWVIDLASKKVIHHTLVAHGKKTGQEFAKKFSNTPNSHMSSLGFYVTGTTYHGKHGLSLYLDGMEAGFNDKARERAIVIHGASYVNRKFINKYGRLGRSFGCPALPKEKTKVIVNAIAQKTCLFIYYPDPHYLQHSKLINANA